MTMCMQEARRFGGRKPIMRDRHFVAALALERIAEGWNPISHSTPLQFIEIVRVYGIRSASVRDRRDALHISAINLAISSKIRRGNGGGESRLWIPKRGAFPTRKTATAFPGNASDDIRDALGGMSELRGWFMIPKRFGLALVWLAAAALAGCDATTGAQGPAPVAAVPPAPSHAAYAALPPGAPCSEKITRYRSVLDADRDTGNVDPPVYEQISREISQAATACSAGHNGEALGLVHASQEKHGYHV
jgi:hypothetical protein